MDFPFLLADPKAYIWAEKLHALKPNASIDSVMKLYKNALERNNVRYIMANKGMPSYQWRRVDN